MAEKPAPRKRPAPKKQMLEAYEQALPLAQEKLEAEVKPQAVVEERIARDAVATADTLSTESVVTSISELRAAVGKTLAQLSDRLEEEVAKYVQVKRAILAKEQELKDIYEIQRQATSLSALIEAQDRKREEFEKDMAEQRESLENEITAGRSAWEADEKQHAAEIKERDSAETKRRQREQEEWRYGFEREQQIARDRFADDQARLDREAAAKRAAAEKDLAERERAVAAHEQELGDLRQRAQQTPSQIEQAVARAVKEATQRLQADAATREELLKNQFAGERNVLTTRITALENTVKEQSEHIGRLSGQADKAYAQVQDIAVKAIEGSSNFKSLTSLGQLFAEQSRRQPAEK
jgi:hypothetical protein